MPQSNKSSSQSSNQTSPVTVFTMIITGIILVFLDTIMTIFSSIELFIMQTPILKQIYYFFMI